MIAGKPVPAYDEPANQNKNPTRKAMFQEHRLSTE